MSNFFDWQYYLNKYPDLRANGVHTEEQALEHWNRFGKKEGRISLSPTISRIDWKYYLDKYPEVDIIREWILYHGYLFGYNNLFIVDNYSTDGTFEAINNFKHLGINIIREIDYKKKGIVITHLIKTYCKNEIAYPLDIDEFIVYYNKDTNSISVDKDIIINYINTLPTYSVYKTNYIISKITNEVGYDMPIEQTYCGQYSDYGKIAKSFFYSKLFKGEIDHGNHYCCDDYYLTSLCLIHYHHRSLNQLKKKIYNNVAGFGYDINNINQLKQLAEKGCNGIHHVHNIISILDNKYTLPISNYNSNTDCLLKPLSNLIIYLKQQSGIV